MAESKERYVQFIFDSKMVSFRVNWSRDDVLNLITTTMKDDGWLWIPYDDEDETGSFVNLNNCTNIKIVEVKQQEDEVAED